METKYVPAIFEAGKLLPLQPLDLREHERVDLTVVRGAVATEDSEDDYIPYIATEADPSVTLEQVQKALASIPGSLVEDFARERDERF
ncbi:MAG TPA: antitoxin family protein [Pirellulales bacterium]|jgi:predicted DNA-binding antitoxin AbrB/MazE fold protein|nr:antitoxin family protein [Pirellulales bacterium]